MIRDCRVGLLLGAGLIQLNFASAQSFVVPERGDAALEATCRALSTLSWPELGEPLDARWVPAGASSSAGTAVPSGRPGEPARLPPHCRVRGTIEPAIHFEVWLPAPASWTGRFLGIGGMDDSDGPDASAMTQALAGGYVAASTDSGHGSGGYAWMGDDGLLRDFGYRAVYEMTAKSRAIVAAFYGRPADHRYFNGCALGGRQGLMEAERFADDYDGIVAGAPGADFLGTRATELWAARSAAPTPGATGLLDPGVLALVSETAIAQCDTFDGVLDGVLEDPRRCNFDPRRLQCAAGAGNRCLTPDQVTAVERIYSGPIDSASGERILPGFAIGSEAGWRFARNGEPSRLTLEFFRRAVFDDPLWDWRDFDFAVDYPAAQAAVGWMLGAAQTDLSAYRDRGGKLIVYQGWNDAVSSPEATIAWYERIDAGPTAGAGAAGAGTQGFARLFMVPGMAHCGGGGTSSFDAQHAIEDWVERGIAPERIEAMRIEDDAIVRTRPLCPYPQTARFRNGDTDRTGSFICSD